MTNTWTDIFHQNIIRTYLRNGHFFDFQWSCKTRYNCRFHHRLNRENDRGTHLSQIIYIPGIEEKNRIVSFVVLHRYLHTHSINRTKEKEFSPMWMISLFFHRYCLHPYPFVYSDGISSVSCQIFLHLSIDTYLGKYCVWNVYLK